MRSKACAPLAIRGRATTLPMCEWQSLLQTTQMKQEEDEDKAVFAAMNEEAVFAGIALLLSFLVRHDEQARSHAASSQLFGSISRALRSCLHAFLNRRTGHPNFLTPLHHPCYEHARAISGRDD